MVAYISLFLGLSFAPLHYEKGLNDDKYRVRVAARAQVAKMPMVAAVGVWLLTRNKSPEVRWAARVELDTRIAAARALFARRLVRNFGRDRKKDWELCRVAESLAEDLPWLRSAFVIALVEAGQLTYDAAVDQVTITDSYYIFGYSRGYPPLSAVLDLIPQEMPRK